MKVALGAILVSSFILKLGLAVSFPDSTPKLDELDYLQLAKGLQNEGRMVDTYRPPLYPLYLAAVTKLGGGDFAIRFWQIVMSTVSVLLVYRIGRSILDRRAATIAAALAAFDPVVFMFTWPFWSETLFIFLLLAALQPLCFDASLRKRWPWVAAGVLLGLAGLTRAMILTFVPFLLPWAILQMVRQENRGPGPGWRSGVLRFGLLALGCALVVLPWTVRNFRVTNALTIVDSNGPYNLLVGNQPESAFVAKDNYWSTCFGRVDGNIYRNVSRKDVATAQRLATRSAIEHIRDAPARFVRKFFWEAGHLWTLDSYLLRHVRNGWWGPGMQGWPTTVITVVSVAFFVSLVLAGTVGLATQAGSPFRGLAILMMIHATVLYGVTFALSRYCLPLHPVLAIAAAGALAAPGRVMNRVQKKGRRRYRTVVWAGVILAMSASWARDIPLVWDMLHTGGSAYQFVLNEDC